MQLSAPSFSSHDWMILNKSKTEKKSTPQKPDSIIAWAFKFVEAGNVHLD
jgi:hypothetical protein